MQFLRTLFWVVIAALAVYLGTRNWHHVTLNLWGDIQADVRVPVLLVLMFMIGFLPPYLILRARIWSLKRRIESYDRQRVVDAVPAPSTEVEESVP